MLLKTSKIIFVKYGKFLDSFYVRYFKELLDDSLMCPGEDRKSFLVQQEDARMNEKSFHWLPAPSIDGCWQGQVSGQLKDNAYFLVTVAQRSQRVPPRKSKDMQKYVRFIHYMYAVWFTFYASKKFKFSKISSYKFNSLLVRHVSDNLCLLINLSFTPFFWCELWSLVDIGNWLQIKLQISNYYLPDKQTSIKSCGLFNFFVP